jgi:thermitase
MITSTLYAIAYTCLLASTLVWYLINARHKNTKYPKIAFFASLALYCLFFLLGDRGVLYKALYILPRDIVVFTLVAMLGNYYSSKPLIYFSSILTLTLGMGLFYFSFLQHSLITNRIPLDSEAELLFCLKSEDKLEQVKGALAQYDAKVSKAFPNIKYHGYSALDEYYVVDVPSRYVDDIEEVMEDLSATKLVESVERNEIVVVEPNQEQGNSSATINKAPYGLNDPDLDKQWGFEKMQMDKFYELVRAQKITPKKKALIAILDTGVDANHDDLKANYRSTSSEFDKDKLGHGTHCAGIAGAVTNNQIGIASIVPDNSFVTITSVKVLSDTGQGSQKSIIDGMIRAADEGADVLSMSLGGYSNDSMHRAYEEAVRYVNESGAIIVVAAGNDNDNANKYLPAGVKGVITVAAVDQNLNKAFFSNYVDDIKMAVSAPGVNVYSTFLDNKYAFLNGTSMATPYVAGLVGVLKSINPKLKTEQAYHILESTGIKTGDTKKTGLLIQPYAAISMKEPLN